MTNRLEESIGADLQKWDLFISHSTRLRPDDEEFVCVLAKSLSRRGLEIYLDRFCVQNGEPIIGCLDDAIHCSRNGLFVLTTQSLRSGWVELELDLMLKLCRAHRMRLLVLQLDPVIKIPHALKGCRSFIASKPYDIPALCAKIYRAVSERFAKLP